MTGTSVIGIKYKDGVLIAADMGGLILINSETLTLLLLDVFAFCYFVEFIISPITILALVPQRDTDGSYHLTQAAVSSV